MATVSQLATPPVSPPYVWEDVLPTETGTLHAEKPFLNEDNLHAPGRLPLASQNGNLTMRAVTDPETPPQMYSDGEPSSEVNEKTLDIIAQHDRQDVKPRSLRQHANISQNSLEHHGATNGERVEDTKKRGPNGMHPDSDSDENSKWIHRDKLAKIESEELQAAGIILPRQRDRERSKSQNRPRRDQSQDKITGSGRSIAGSENAVPRSRKNSAATTTDMRTLDAASIPSWDLRRPEEIQEEGDGHWVVNANGKGSRIPVAKDSPVPIPTEHLARDARLPRRRDGSPGLEDTITYPKPRARSGSTGNALAKVPSTPPTTQANKRPDSSPKKPATATVSKKPKPANGTAGRPKTRGAASKDSTSSGTATTRPSTRSGEREFSSSHCKPMEGEPPWMVSAYRPDPRLPPDQQLLPTVAKRLQQEKWEREGKFGSVYDKEFRPLTDEGFLKPPENGTQEKEVDKEAEKEGQKENEGDWPLKAEAKSPTLPARTNSYSTMPKIADTPAVNTLPSPRTPGHQPQLSQTVRVPEPPEETTQKKGGCGCCIVM
ncbi:hypothetical protein N657DRAFT_631684 [Parathielavia appendiculata]|uniref:TeaA receptor TeaR n=1 Tax=Parathielavia appendiculata TaxID=2587402 RepID=A0AAN6Z7L3_9PEZI|nr:hypothetical protein N657DRAFT_631684 [Parathielavia appendiculata]